MKKIIEDLTFEEMSSMMSEILNGKNNDEEIVEFLKDLSDKGETNEELRAMFTKMNEYSVNINPSCHGNLIDVCGTGEIICRHSIFLRRHHLLLQEQEEVLLNTEIARFQAYQEVQISLSILDSI